ncbi:hypothetical protein J5N97_022833 [Dioscorea zingiberensis]|uniref:Uncharacterized protein n=1 Tax=Dioscorea zingiberensis TaxID=325984 RepID=A0A9D5CBB2_9LILI|nr:hypothetical protein J5N97_022833 [Dioscorea zingiberensis]
MAASPKPREATPPPVIGKAGRYTVFITPPPTPRPSSISPGEGSAIAPTTGSGAAVAVRQASIAEGIHINVWVLLGRYLQSSKCLLELG